MFLSNKLLNTHNLCKSFTAHIEYINFSSSSLVHVKIIRCVVCLFCFEITFLCIVLEQNFTCFTKHNKLCDGKAIC